MFAAREPQESGCSLPEVSDSSHEATTISNSPDIVLLVVNHSDRHINPEPLQRFLINKHKAFGSGGGQ